jgi:hypothetical protein
MEEVQANHRVMTKALLYAMQFPTSDLIGAITADDLFPLFHTPPTTLFTEIALQQLSEYQLIGFFESRNRAQNEICKPSKLMESLCSAFEQHTGQKPVVLSLDTVEDKFILKLDAWETNKFVYVSQNDKLPELPSESITLVDFDMHFEDATLDWRNPDIGV